MKFQDLSGKQFGRLTVIRRYGRSSDNQTLWECRCSCGAYTVVRAHFLLKGKTQSCGCLRNEKSSERLSKHGNSRTRLYRIWGAIKGRCYNPHNTSYKNYGGRGIAMYPLWKNDFMSFRQWAIENGYRDGLTIDRIDIDGNYDPSNCRWVTNLEQQSNRRDNFFIEYNGERKIVSQWAREYGIKANVLALRLRNGWDAEKAFTTPVKKIGRK